MKALIINGFDWKAATGRQTTFFWKSGNLFREFLLAYLKLEEEDIFEYGVGKENAPFSEMLDFMKMVEEKSKKEPLIVYYAGHSIDGEDGWFFAEHTYFRYQEFLEVFEKRKSPLIVINDCCFAMKLAPYMDKIAGCRNLLIGSSPENRHSYASDKIITSILEFWKAKKPANPEYYNGKKFVRTLKDRKSGKVVKVKLRKGDRLDHLCYPRRK